MPTADQSVLQQCLLRTLGRRQLYDELLCAVVNQFYDKIKGLSDYLDEYSEVVRARNPGTQLPGYRDVTLRQNIHQ